MVKEVQKTMYVTYDDYTFDSQDKAVKHERDHKLREDLQAIVTHSTYGNFHDLVVQHREKLLDILMTRDAQDAQQEN